MMSHRELIQGELERLFLNAGLSELCIEYLGIDPVELGLYDELRSVFARRLLDWCEKESATEALVDAVMIKKKAQADRRIRKISESRYPADDLQIGNQIDDFVVLEKIGDGGLGAVYKCMRKDGDEDDDHPGYGLRVIRAEHAMDLQAANRFKTLMRSMKSDHGPALQRIEAVGNLQDGRMYVVFEWTKGLPIKEFVPLEVLDALDMLESVMSALDSVHQQGLVHGDINVENVVIRAVPRDESGKQNVTLLGFGVDRLFYRPTLAPSSSQVYGRFSGLTPEQARGEEPTSRSDIYSLGSLLFELVSGKAPFAGKSPIETVAAHLLEPVPMLSDNTDDPAAIVLDKIIEKTMSKEPRWRPPGLDALQVMLDAARRSVEEIKARTATPGSLEDIEKAATAFLEDPSNTETFEALRKEAKQHNAWGAFIETIEEAAITVEDSVVVRRLLLEAARISVRNIRDYAKAHELHTQLSEANPDDPEINEAKRELMRAEGRYEELIAELAGLAESTEDQEKRVKLLREIGSIYHDSLKDHSTAFDYYLACLTTQDTDTDLLGLLDRLADRTERFEELTTKCAGLAEEAEAAENLDSAVFFYKKTGEYYFERLDQAAYALSCYLKALEFKPGDVQSLKSVSDLYRSAKQFAELAEVLMLLAEAEATPVARREHMVEAAAILHEHLGNTEGAVALFESVVADDPAQKKAVEVLSTIYEAGSSWQKLTSLLAGSVEALPVGPELAVALHRLGELYEFNLDELKLAREYYEKALEIDDRHPESLEGLERIMSRTGDASGLKANLLVQLELQSTPKKQVALRERLALLLEEEFKDFDGAIDQLRNVLQVDSKDAAALASLTRLYRANENWEDLVEVLKTRAAEAVTEEKTDLLKQRAKIIREKIGDAKLAAEAFKEVTSLGADDELDTLATAQEEASEFESAVLTIKKMADDAEDVESKVDLMLRVAHLEIDSLEKPEDGVATLRTVQNIAPENGVVLRELRRGLVAQGNYTAALDVLSEEIGLADGHNARADLIAVVGVISLDHLGDKDRARERFEQALEMDKNNLVASDRLAEIYRLGGDWEKALRIYERWSDASEALSDEKRIELFTRTAEAYDHLEKPELALATYMKVSNIAGEDDELVLKLGKAALRAEDFELAKEQFQIYMKSKGANLSDDEKVEVLVGLGRAAFLAGDVTEAAKSARQATVMSPDHREALVLLADVLEQRRDFRGFIDSCERVLAGMDIKNPEYVSLLRRAGLVQFEKLRDNDNAVRKFTQALEIEPDNRVILNDVLKIYTSTKQYNKVIETVLKTASLVDDPQQLARYYVAVAKIYKRELRQINKAIEYYEMALEKDETLQQAEEAIVDILVENKDWEQLAQHYKIAVERLSEDAMAEEKIALLKPLADVLVHNLKDRKEGIVVTETLAKLDPDNVAWKEQLGDLYGWEKEYISPAIELHRAILRANPGRVDSFRKLFNIFSVANEPDKAWCTASLISLLNKGTPEELSYYRKFLPEDVPPISSCLENDQWTNGLIHHELNQTVSKIFATIAPVVLSVKGKKLTDYGLTSGAGIDVTVDPSPFAGFVNFVASSLGVTPPPLYYSGSHNGTFELLGADTPILVADSDEGILSDRKGISFALGQQLTLLRPGYFVHKLVKSGSELSAWLLASIKSFVPKLPVSGDLAGAVAERLEPMRSLDKRSLELLQGYVQSFVAQTADVDMKKWGLPVEYTMDRAGLLLCGDVGTAVRILTSQVKDPTRQSERLKALTAFAISEEYFKLRIYLGIALKTG